METSPGRIPDTGTILVVDDDDNWCYLTKKTLRKAGVGKQIITAYNGEEAIKQLQALDAIQQGMPQLILLDIKMPVMDGFDFLEEVSSSTVLNFEQTKVFMYSSSFHPKDRERAARYPIAGFITKPITIEAITDILKTT